MSPVQVPTTQTLAFVTAHVRPARRILEVGCGDGDLARSLVGRGHTVVAVDSSVDAVARTRALGVKAVQATWPDYWGDSVDAVLFARSLHHIEPLTESIAQARDHLASDGILLVEDYAFSEVDEATAQWFESILHALQHEGAVTDPQDGSFGSALISRGGGISRWREHMHSLHTAHEIEAALQAQFGSCVTSTAPYLYRFLVPLAGEGEAGVQLVERFFELERAAIQKRLIMAVGRRFVAR